MTLWMDGRPSLSLILLAAGAVLGAVMAAWVLRRQGEESRKAAAVSGLMLLLAAPLCVYGAHLAYCLMDLLNLYRMAENPALLLDLSYGGFALYGGMLGFAFACAAVSRLTGRRFSGLLDALVPAGLVVIAFVRLAEGASGQGISFDVENPAFCFFPLSVYDPEWEVWNLALFMLEAVYALAAAFALAFGRRVKPGRRIFAGLSLYAGMQIWFESLRRDNFMRCFGGFVRTMQLASAVIMTVLLLCALHRAGWRPGAKALAFAFHALCLAGVVTLEFAVEYKIGFLEQFSMEVLSQAGHYALCYGCMLLCVLALMANIRRARWADQLQS